MGRSRLKKEDAWLPERVYRGKSAYEYRPKDAKYIVLCAITRDNGVIVETPAIKKKVLEAYEKATTVTKKDIAYWLNQYFLSSRYLHLSPDTQTDYLRYAEIKAKKEEPNSRNGVRVVFGKMLPKAVRPHHIRRYMDYWGKAEKYTTANRHLSFLQTFFAFLREHNTGVIENPASGVKKFPEQKRKYYVSDSEYEKLIKTALAMPARKYVAAFIEITYLCGLRKFEALQLNVEDITPAGLIISRGKGSSGEITEISPRLQAAIDLAISLHKQPEPIRDRPLLRNTRNQRVTRSAINQAFDDVRQAAGLSHIVIHDLKKKAVTDGKDVGHKTQAMRDLYNLKASIKPATK